MNKRLEKRHKRQVSRAKERVAESLPDIRTPEQLKAARESSRAVTRKNSTSSSLYPTPVKSETAS
jgi:hypothetical protein